MTRRRIFELLFLLAAVAALAALLWRLSPGPAGEAPDLPRALVPSDHPGDLSILGVRPGMTRAEVEALLGPGRRWGVLGGTVTTGYGHPETADDPGRQDRWAEVTWRSDGTVGRITGSHVHREGREVLGRGWPVEAARNLLGDPLARESDSRGDYLRWSDGAAWVRRGHLQSFSLPR